MPNAIFWEPVLNFMNVKGVQWEGGGGRGNKDFVMCFIDFNMERNMGDLRAMSSRKIGQNKGR